MLSNSIAKKLREKNFHYAWIMVGVTFFIMLTTSCALGAPGVLMNAVAKEFNWSIAQISGALSLRLLLFGLIAPFAAGLMRKYGDKTIVMAALLLILSGLILSLFINQIWQLILTWGILTGIGAGMTAIVLGATIATKWFSEKRGLIIGILAASNATGQLLFLPLLASVVTNHGWRAALAIVCFLLFLAFIAAFLLMRNHPSDLGLTSYGAKKSDVEIDNNINLDPIAALMESAKSPAFWILFGTFFVCGASTNGLVQTHFISFCGDMGMLAVASASILALMGIFDLFGTIGSGWLTDRYDARYLLFAYYSLRGLSLLYLPHADFTIAGLSPFAVFYGLDWIATVPPTLRLVTQYFGREKASMVFGWVFAGHQIGAASIAFFAGWVRTAYETYIYAFEIAGVLCLLAAIAALFANIGKKGEFVTN